MRRYFDRLSIIQSIVLIVSLVLMACLLPLYAWTVHSSGKDIDALALERAETALDMLESVHVNSMLNRGQVEDGDGAIATLNGTMEQLSKQNHGLDVWMSMGPKVLEFQKKAGNNELELPQDDIDKRSIETGTVVVASIDSGHVRVSRPSVLGQGAASDPKCAACHTAMMGIQPGEVIGAYSVSVDMNGMMAGWWSRVVSQGLAGILAVGIILGTLAVLLRVTAMRPLLSLAKVTGALAQGETNIDINGIERKDALGTMAQSLAVFRTNLQEKNRLEKENAAAMEAVRAADRAKSEFLANMSHEIRTPMNGVLGMAELLGKTEMAPKQAKFVDVIIRSGNALLTIINDILDFSKIDAGQLTLDNAPFNLTEAIGDVMTLLSARASEKELELILRIDPSLGEMYVGDVGRVRQILTNLVGNAVKFTEKGHVLVNISGIVERGVANLSIAVSDTGLGIPVDKLKVVFEQFSQVDASNTRRHEGTGLGLAIASRLVKLMDGAITVTSTLGRGSTFTVSMKLPAHEGVQHHVHIPTELKGARILVVDDNQVNRDILMEQFTNWGFDCAATESAAMCTRFLDQASSYGIAIDCLVLDYHMPDVNGEMLAMQLDQDARFSSIPKVLLTSVDQNDYATLVASGTLAAWLTKPAPSKQLRETVIRVIHQTRLKAVHSVSGLKDLARVMREAPTHVNIQSVIIEQPVLQQVIAPAKSDVPFILVAEDNEVNQFVVAQMLDGIGLAHEIKANGLLLVQTWQECKPSLILMDVSMPVMNGLEATQRIRELEAGSGHHTPIIGLTAHALKGDFDRCIEAGMDDYLTKPVSPERLESVIRKWLEKGAKRVA
jgi:signal transduction histidine kinase/CheY-like chemotaxis protein